MASIMDRLKGVWNAFTAEAEDPYRAAPPIYGGYFGVNPNRTRSRINTERTIIASIYTRMSMDAASVQIRHTRHDDSDRYLEDINSGLNNCLTVEANIDQAARAFRQDVFGSMFTQGCIAIVPVDTTIDPRLSGSYDIKTMRVGEVVQWYPNQVRVCLYNDQVGVRQEITISKSYCAIVENPLYSVMNEPNSTLQRLVRKLSLLDAVDEATSSGKLDLIIQLPYVIKSEARRLQAEDRRKDIEFQLKGSQYGIAYTDGTEKITQLNRPAENNLLGQIQDLKTQLYSELGITPTVMDGTANEATMINYNNRTIEPLVTAVIEAMKRTFLTKTALTQGQSVDAFQNPFKLTPLVDLAASFDILGRNEILTSNEMRQFLGVKPSSDPKADTLINSNMPVDDTGVAVPPDGSDPNAPTDGTSTDPIIPDNTPADTSPLDSVGDSISAAFSAFGATPPVNETVAPPNGNLDPDVVLSSLDELDKSIDAMFAGLGLDDAPS